jgi:hypothetical protein
MNNAGVYEYRSDEPEIRSGKRLFQLSAHCTNLNHWSGCWWLPNPLNPHTDSSEHIWSGGFAVSFKPVRVMSTDRPRSRGRYGLHATCVSIGMPSTSFMHGGKRPPRLIRADCQCHQQAVSGFDRRTDLGRTQHWVHDRLCGNDEHRRVLAKDAKTLKEIGVPVLDISHALASIGDVVTLKVRVQN